MKNTNNIVAIDSVTVSAVASSTAAGVGKQLVPATQSVTLHNHKLRKNNGSKPGKGEPAQPQFKKLADYLAENLGYKHDHSYAAEMQRKIECEFGLLKNLPSSEVVSRCVARAVAVEHLRRGMNKCFDQIEDLTFSNEKLQRGYDRSKQMCTDLTQKNKELSDQVAALREKVSIRDEMLVGIIETTKHRKQKRNKPVRA